MTEAGSRLPIIFSMPVSGVAVDVVGVVACGESEKREQGVQFTYMGEPVAVDSPIHYGVHMER